MTTNLRRECFVLLAALLLAGCGNKGDLVLPDKAETDKSAPAKPAAAPNAPEIRTGA